MVVCELLEQTSCCVHKIGDLSLQLRPPLFQLCLWSSSCYYEKNQGINETFDRCNAILFEWWYWLEKDGDYGRMGMGIFWGPQVIMKLADMTSPLMYYMFQDILDVVILLLIQHGYLQSCHCIHFSFHINPWWTITLWIDEMLPPHLCSVWFITFMDSCKANLVLGNFAKKLGFVQNPQLFPFFLRLP